MKKESQIIGCIEKVSFPDLGIVDALAKVDTGAFSGAFHCTDIKVFRKVKSGKRILRFAPAGDHDKTSETEEFKETFIRSATGHRVRRFVISTRIIVDDREYPIWIGLSDRSDMKRPVLIGRRFLRENGLIVDVRINQELDDEGENTK